jgi:hypothetical protein
VDYERGKKNKLLAMEMDLRRSAKLLKTERIQNDKIRIIGGEETVSEKMDRKRLKWYGHVM